MLFILYFPFSRFILAIDRRQSVCDMKDTVELAFEYQTSTEGIVVGVDLSGDFMVSDILFSLILYIILCSISTIFSKGTVKKLMKC